jgi:hypothetical protein
MAYIKDPKTGKYINTGSAPTTPPLTVPSKSAPTTEPVKYTKDASGKYTTVPSDTPTTKPKVTTVAGLRDYATQQGVDISGTEPKPSILQSVLHLLNTGGYAVGGLISGKGIKAGIKEHILPSEALGIKSKVGGFIADILLDPTTYITFGYGAGAKLATKAGTVVLSKTGTSLLKKSIVELGEEGARKLLAQKVLEEGGEKLLAKGGLKFAGTQVLPRNVVTAPFKAADWIAEKTPVLGKVYQGAKDLAGKAFVPFKSIKDLPGGIGEEYVDKFSSFSKATRDEVSKAVQEAAELGKTARETLGKNAGVTIGRTIEGMASAKPADAILSGLKGYEREFIKSKGVNLDNLVITETATKKPADIFSSLSQDVQKEVLEKAERETAKRSTSRIVLLQTDEGLKVLDGSHKLAGLVGKKADEPVQYFVVTERAMRKAETGNKIVDDLINNIRTQHKEFATAEKARGLLDYELPDYLRHYLTPEGREFLQKTGANITSEISRPLRPKTPFAKSRTIDDTIEGINKYFQSRYGVRLFEEDAFKAFAARKAEHIKATKTYDFLTDIGKEFGRAANVVTKEVKSPITGKISTKEVIKPIFENGIKYVESSVPQLKGVLLPEPIVKHVDDTYRVLTDEDATKKFLGLYDKVLGFWKGSVTGWFPAFHVRNSIGGIFNNWIAGVKSPARYLQGDQIARGVKGTITTKLGTKYSYDQIRELANKLGVVGQPGYLDVMREVEKDIGKGPMAKLMDAPKYAMETVENRLRLPLFVDRLIKGDAPEQAAKSVFQFHFDYAPEALTSFEKNIMKRLMPFYRWTRGNIPLQFEQMIKQPGKYAAIGKLTENLQTDKEKAKEEFQYLPPYMREGLPVRLGEKDGFSQYLYGLGLPVEDINRIWKGDAKRTVQSMVGELSPILKYPIEVGTGQNLFTGEPIAENSRVFPFMNAIPGLREWLEVSEHKNKDGSVSYRGNAYKLHFLNTALGRFYNTAGKLTDDKSSGAVKFLYGLIGAKAKPVDIEKEKFWREQELQDRLEQALESRGLINKFERAYVPK